MRDNLIYDMESTTSPSSSDSDSSPVNNARDLPADAIVLNPSSASAIAGKPVPAKIISLSRRVVEHPSKSQSDSPLKEVSTIQKSNAASSSSQKQLSARGDLRGRRRSLASAHKRWSQ